MFKQKKAPVRHDKLADTHACSQNEVFYEQISKPKKKKRSRLRFCQTLVIESELTSYAVPVRKLTYGSD